MKEINLIYVPWKSIGYEMPRLGFGVYQVRGESCLSACSAALECGYRHIDSAVSYKNEVEVGQAVRSFGRSAVFVTSKISSRWQKSSELAVKTISASLTNLGFDYIDLYLLHDAYSGTQKRLEAYRVLAQFQREGKIRSIGVSNYNIHHLEEIEAAGLPTPSVNQIELHPFCQQRPIVEYCRRKGIVIQAYSPLLQGKIIVATEPDNSPGDALSQIVRVKRAGGLDVNLYQVLLRWSLQKGFVPLPKSEHPDRIRENADVFCFGLNDTEMDSIDSLDQGDQGAVTWNPVNAP
ncbi:Aldo/keto reductase [Clavulina sp. PMI_390]|nr:Aldo/keto reductase [Clavulina sp. PMI_390]